jgi:hypothetical protein
MVRLKQASPRRVQSTDDAEEGAPAEQVAPRPPPVDDADGGGGGGTSNFSIMSLIRVPGQPARARARERGANARAHALRRACDGATSGRSA